MLAFHCHDISKTSSWKNKSEIVANTALALVYKHIPSSQYSCYNFRIGAMNEAIEKNSNRLRLLYMISQIIFQICMLWHLFSITMSTTRAKLPFMI